MDIVAESLSANILKARNVTVRGQEVLTWFESKLSASVSFVGVFDDLSAAPARNGAVAIVGSKDYIYSSTTSAWQEFGDEGQIGVLTQAVAALSNCISGCVTSSDVDSVLSAKRDLLDLLYMVKPQSPDARDKWVLTGPIEKYSKVVLDPYDDPGLDTGAGEMAWGWWADEITDGRCAYLTWDGESVWTLLVRDGLLTYLSASVDGEWDDLSVSFTGENGEWVIDRAAEADMLALDGNVKKWVENQNYLTEHQDITGKQDKISVDGILSCDGDGNIAAAKMPQNVSDLSNDVGYLSNETDPVFQSLSGNFLTSHQSLSGVMPFATASEQLQALTRDLGIQYTAWKDPFEPNDNAGNNPTEPIWFYPRAFGMPDGAAIRAVTIHTTSTSDFFPDGITYARIFREGSENAPLAKSGPVVVNARDTLYTFTFGTDVPLQSNIRYGVRFYNGENSATAVKMAYRLYYWKKQQGGPWENPGNDIAYGQWDGVNKDLLRPTLQVRWTDGSASKDFSTVLSGKTYQYDGGTAWMANALADIISAMGGVVENFPG